ncbi:radical SAM family heme chaperone HemW [Bartonella tamiae]|uniref:Heme chaperone HemW n=1 Tax=Bartonella tamiae Th239 TaxID=1094558 RepID=J1K0U7_9HYPH|nr:radical SAM family heme chaperone HemW [Bartonella tamiae]EJF91052.1 hypothetical protein ME5_00384 [Bartonella tamiae Th239]EJF93283.1 hypothetical protein MEG_01497 [Bartonella tamiae Th307]
MKSESFSDDPLLEEPFGVYVHWPFCAAKCPYCDFNSHVRMQGVDQPRFVEGFRREIAHMYEKTGRRRVTSVFFGGGTPSLMEPHTLDAILKTIDHFWPLENDAEITMEANPSSVEADRFHGYRAAGVNRLSLGVQALDDDSLKKLGRLHNVQQALYAIKLARQIFPRLSFDLIYARPHQSLSNWKNELLRAIDLAADHLSLYQLTIEEGTIFHRLFENGKLIMPEAELAADLYALTQEVTALNGLPAYEISNHAAYGAHSRHNLLYWRYHEYVGVGPGAHGRFIPQSEVMTTASLNQTRKRLVTITEKHPETWLNHVENQGHGIVETESLTLLQQSDEMLLMGLRLYEGLDLSRYEALGAPALQRDRIQKLTDEGLIEAVGNAHLRATPKGRIVLDHVIARLAQ